MRCFRLFFPDSPGIGMIRHFELPRKWHIFFRPSRLLANFDGQVQVDIMLLTCALMCCMTYTGDNANETSEHNPA